MESYRENIVRGTPDFPFSHYRAISYRDNVMAAPVHWHPDLEILYIRKGAADVMRGGNHTTLEPGTIAFVQPNELHAIWLPKTDSWYDAIIIPLELITLPDSHFFQSQFIQPLEAGTLLLPSVLNPSSKAYATVAQAIDTICTCDKAADTYKTTVFCSVITICTAIAEFLELGKNQQTKGNETVKACMRYMHKHYGTRLTLQELAEHVHLHPNYLCALFKQITGQTLFQQLTRIRVEEAARLLRSGSASVSAAAASCGFESAGFFAKKFKAIIGMSPKEYSKKFRD